MTFRPPRLQKSRSSRFSSESPTTSPGMGLRTPSSTSHLFPLKTAPHVRRERDTPHLGMPVLQPVFALPGGNDFTHQILHATSFRRRQKPRVSDDPFLDTPLDIFETDHAPANAHRKKAQQRKTWVEKVIPALIRPYLVLLDVSDDLRRICRVSQQGECTCDGPHAQLTVLCVYLQRTQ